MRSSPPGPLFSCDVLFLASVHYRAWVNGSGEPIHDTWQEQQRKEMVIGHGTYPNPQNPTVLKTQTSQHLALKFTIPPSKVDTHIG